MVSDLGKEFLQALSVLTYRIPILKCIMHPDTRRSELTDRMVHVMATRRSQETYDIIACLQSHDINDNEWSASVIGYDGMKDPICLLEIVIPDQKKAVYFKMFYDHPMPIMLNL